MTGNNQIKVDKDHREFLRDKPNGKVIEKSGDFEIDTVYFLKADGDWAYVRIGTVQPKIMKGWMRWRNGREFLVGCVFNNFKVPEPQTTSQ
jgi:hypothetical protein